MATMYELRADYALLMEMINGLEDGASQEDQDMILETWKNLEDDLQYKADSYSFIAKNIEMEIAALKAKQDVLLAEVDRLGRMMKTRTNTVERMKQTLFDMMKQTGMTKFKTKLFSYGIQKNPPTLVIDTPDFIPKQFLVEQAPKVDKTAIKEYCKKHECEFAHLEQTERLVIR